MKVTDKTTYEKHIVQTLIFEAQSCELKVL